MSKIMASDWGGVEDNVEDNGFGFGRKIMAKIMHFWLIPPFFISCLPLTLNLATAGIRLWVDDEKDTRAIFNSTNFPRHGTRVNDLFVLCDVLFGACCHSNYPLVHSLLRNTCEQRKTQCRSRSAQTFGRQYHIIMITCYHSVGVIKTTTTWPPPPPQPCTLLTPSRGAQPPHKPNSAHGRMCSRCHAPSIQPR